MQTALYGKIKESRGVWLIGANTRNVTYFSIIATQHKTRQRRVRHLLMKVNARSRAGAQIRINNW